MSHAVNDEALDIIFRNAHTQNAWTDKPVSPAIIMAIYDLLRLAPTASNMSPARFVFVTSKEAKERLSPHMSEGNRAKTLAAPCTAIIGYDLKFAEHLPKLFPHRPEMKNIFSVPQIAEPHAIRNGTLQGAYFMIAARALGLDCGPMSGFNPEGVEKEFFPDSSIKVNFLCNIGYGDPKGAFPRNPRLDFDEACKIV
ncbi:MAG: malonic semialdehyde reductase [Alphaproteobacteria bacterium]|nr:malonic semialdehyde reductase [Alphaproteobacteria bacterium]